jgi:hypothetical protein
MQMHTHQFLLYFCPVVLLGLHGCSSIHTYPENWTKRVTDSEHECPDISGVYNNSGVTSRTSGSGSYLYDKITNEGIAGTHECACEVVLQWTRSNRDELVVTLRDYAGTTVEETLLDRAKGDFSCKDGAMTVEFAEGYERVTDGFIRFGNRKFMLAESGGLILEERGRFIAHLLFVVPFAAEYVDYSLWEISE